MQYARTLWELLERRVDATPDALMAVDEDMRTLTFAEFWSEAELAAAGLTAAGVRAGDVVTWQLPTWMEALVLTAALSRLDVIQNPVLPTYRERELDLITAQAGTSLLVTPSEWRGFDHEALATGVARRQGGMRVLVAARLEALHGQAHLTVLVNGVQTAEACADDDHVQSTRRSGCGRLVSMFSVHPSLRSLQGVAWGWGRHD